MTIAMTFDNTQAEGLQAEDLYAVLMSARSPRVDEFDAHVIASVLALSFCEAVAEAKPLTSAVGLSGDALSDCVAEFFPEAACRHFLVGEGAVDRSTDEICLVDLLTNASTARTKIEAWLASMIARRAQRPNHLWQDLGLPNRADLTHLMMHHFKVLARRNSQDMKWKKFFYRAICANATYALCTAPSCGECDDFEHCFGEETGESLLARSRLA